MSKKHFVKVDENTLKITEEVVVKPAVSTYTYNDLVSNLANLKIQKATFNTEIDHKIIDAQELIDAADGLGIVAVQVEIPQ